MKNRRLILVQNSLVLAVTVHDGQQTLHRVDGLVVVLREVDAELVQELRSELSAGRDDDAGKLADVAAVVSIPGWL